MTSDQLIQLLALTLITLSGYHVNGLAKRVEKLAEMLSAHDKQLVKLETRMDLYDGERP